MAATAALAVAAGEGGIAAGGAASSAAGNAAESALARNLGAKKANGQKAARRGDTGGAWQRMGLRALKKAVKRHTECVAFSTGQVQEFLLRTPCKRLDRMLFTVGDGNGNSIVVAVSWVEFRARDSARTFRELSDTYGTGFVRPLGGAVLEMADVQLTGQHYKSRPAGAVTVTAEAEPVAGQFDDTVLDAIAEVATWIPRPR